MKFIFSIILLCFSAKNSAQVKIPNYECERTSETYNGYGKLCSALEHWSEVEDEESPYFYEYEEEMARLAKVDYAKDGDQLFVAKIQAYFAKCYKCILCSTIRTHKVNIQLLKVAVAIGNIDFLRRAVTVFKFPLDVIDEIDGMNIMDYVYEEKDYWDKKFPGSKEQELVAKMFDIVKQGGGKYHKYQHLNNTYKK